MHINPFFLLHCVLVLLSAVEDTRDFSRGVMEFGIDIRLSPDQDGTKETIIQELGTLQDNKYSIKL
jgi:hypothetical protein